MTPSKKKPTRKVKDLRPSPRNPRTMSPEDLADLDAAMREYGDLGGIVFNRLTGRLVGAHQRVRNLDPEAEVVITKRYKEPTKQGTVAIGHVEVDGELWAYREVEFTEERELAANLAANRFSGAWEEGMLALNLQAVLESEEDARLTGFSKEEINQLLGLQMKRTTRRVPMDLPPTTWVLIGVSTTEYGLAAPAIQQIAGIPGVFCEIVTNDQELPDDVDED